MGSKLWFTGATLVLVKAVLPVPAVETVGAVLMAIGCISMWLDK